jgi:ribosomal protein S18 acetylase RimI-like enzyme
MKELVLRRATTTDEDDLARALYAAWHWRDPWDEASFRRHRDLGATDSYVDGFGHRPGDAGLIAEAAGGPARYVAGAAWYRLFTTDDHRAGFVAEDIPELVLAVTERARGHGLGRRLAEGLVELALATGVRGLSLHVSDENIRAANLYRSLGFAVVGDHQGRGSVMLLEVDDWCSTSAAANGPVASH